MAGDVYPGDSLEIISHPSSVDVNAGEPFQLTVGVDGDTAQTSFQWFYDDMPIPGAIEPTHQISNASLKHGGDYYVMVSRGKNSMQSELASVRVLIPDATDALEIKSQPSDISVFVGELFSLSFEVSGGQGEISYRWFLNETLIPGANQSSYSVTFAELQQAGSYHVEISDDKRSIRSTMVNVEVLPAVDGPFIQQPMDTVILQGKRLELSAKLKEDPGDATYEWLRNGNKVEGGDLETLVVENAQVSDSGAYRVVVKKGNETIMSREARVRILTQLSGISWFLEGSIRRNEEGLNDTVNISRVFNTESNNGLLRFSVLSERGVPVFFTIDISQENVNISSTEFRDGPPEPDDISDPPIPDRFQINVTGPIWGGKTFPFPLEGDLQAQGSVRSSSQESVISINFKALGFLKEP